MPALQLVRLMTSAGDYDTYYNPTPQDTENILRLYREELKDLWLQEGFEGYQGARLKSIYVPNLLYVCNNPNNPSNPDNPDNPFYMPICIGVVQRSVTDRNSVCGGRCGADPAHPHDSHRKLYRRISGLPPSPLSLSLSLSLCMCLCVFV